MHQQAVERNSVSVASSNGIIPMDFKRDFDGLLFLHKNMLVSNANSYPQIELKDRYFAPLIAKPTKGREKLW